ncbi:MAG: DUF4915 domain-containing protein [Sphingobium sp.]
MIGGHAIVTVSKPRDGSFAGLALNEELAKRDSDPWCGILIVSLSTGDIVDWIRLEGAITELFDVAMMPGLRCPMSFGPQSPELRSMIAFEDAISPLQN